MIEFSPAPVGGDPTTIMFTKYGMRALAARAYTRSHLSSTGLGFRV